MNKAAREGVEISDERAPDDVTDSSIKEEDPNDEYHIFGIACESEIDRVEEKLNVVVKLQEVENFERNTGEEQRFDKENIIVVVGNHEGILSFKSILPCKCV